jgi:E3 ubiquitin-protein ligase DRIP
MLSIDFLYRADHSLLYVRSKIFPFKRRKVEVEDQEVTSPIVSPVKRKERSLSSLAVHGPRVSIQKCLTKRRTKAPCLRSLSSVCSFCSCHCAPGYFISTSLC